MKIEYFVAETSIVREIWGKSDTILFIFAGASAEFALNKAVDWLYFTGRLPQDPIGRLFSTVAYAREIVFSEEDEALKSIETINKIHSTLEAKRGMKIPDWAYRDVLFMLIDYSIKAYEILEKPLTLNEKEEVFEVFQRVGGHMHIKDLPKSYREFLELRKLHIENDLLYGKYTKDLYQQYRKHLGWFRYKLLIETQILITPKSVRNLLTQRSFSLLKPLLYIYKISRNIKIEWILRSMILPAKYKQEIKAMDHAIA